ncbi:right-handed parallel beta-helix repeat-containing protein [Streptomyces sp. SID12488]|uniref:right-handed parallel beta-helix repeat-containing protein n=1 Tax=Streptomyces sp. SID12488 TaxID=2706040 RepID=UPI0013DD4789|nr:right-handed parallel beta-helix repeat-containing protein [Streptomyces sp. SID12488]NEA68069.1 hypothetical protein [Streptomyces sp. SID12488]
MSSTQIMPSTPPPAPGGSSFRQPAVWLAAGAFLLALTALIVAMAGGGGAEPKATAGATTAEPRASTTEPPPTEAAPSALPTRSATGKAQASQATSGSVPDSAVTCPAASVKVSDAATLEQALAQAQPGDSISLANGTYAGNFTTKLSGTAEKPIFLCGGSGAVIDGGDTEDGYAFHLNGVSYWRLVGFTVRNAQKGVMADGVVGTVIQGLTVEQIGDEAVHLRNFSSDNMVRDNTIRTTGLRREKYGEGIYIGTAESNWCTVTDCKKDTSDRNVVLGNHISGTTAESIDIKEGTSGGKVIDNTFDGSKLSGSHNNDSWVDVKGNGWLIQGNTGSHSPEDGFQTHQIVKGWGTGNTFKGNTANVDGPGYGFHLTSDGNTVTCDNKADGVAEGLANVDCTS